jgi:hypothetical protein
MWTFFQHIYLYLLIRITCRDITFWGICVALIVTPERMNGTHSIRWLTIVKKFKQKCIISYSCIVQDNIGAQAIACNEIMCPNKDACACTHLLADDLFYLFASNEY